MLKRITVHGARQHNLKNIDVEIPRNTFTVITGLSGSGKSSLAFDTIYAEGQRRYVETLSPYARQFLDQMERPEVDSIDGLSPAISIEQKTTSRSPRSTVGTITEIYDYLRVLYSAIGVPHCPNCGIEISRQSTEQILQQILMLPQGERIMILAPIVRGRKGEYKKDLEKLSRQGFVRARIDGVLRSLDEEIPLDRRKNHNIEIVVDRLPLKPGSEKRIEASLETAGKLADGLVIVAVVHGEEKLYSQKLACPNCGASVPQLEPRSFSFNSPFGACETCNGLGNTWSFDPAKVIVDPSKPLLDGGLGPGASSSYMNHTLSEAAERLRIKINKPFEELPKRTQTMLLEGGNGFAGVVKILGEAYEEASSGYREWLMDYMSPAICPACHGRRLRPSSLAVSVKGAGLAELTEMSIDRALAMVKSWTLQERERHIAGRVIDEIRNRLEFLTAVGLNYLSLSRSATTLSGGEAQRIRLATQIGSKLRGVLYVLDEPSIGLHPRDNDRLLDTLSRLRDLGNTVLVVEHDAETIERADYVIDLGPGAGRLGGGLVAAGTPSEIRKNPASLTGQYLSGAIKIEPPSGRRHGSGKKLIVHGAREHNLKDLTVEFPLGSFIVITGVSGSGKSTLVNDILYRSLAKELYGSHDAPGEHDSIQGLENIDKVVEIDQSAIGRTPRSNPATYTGVFTPIRELYAMLPESRERGYKAGRFSFNVKGGRCEACQGDGLKRIEMNFLPDVYVTCDVCHARRYNSETLQVKYKGHSIADLLEATVEDAIPVLENIPQIQAKLKTLHDVGLGYIHLGQSSTTLSGGEAQRIKLARELSKRQTGRTLYILDEPTTGLHFEDIKRLLDVLQRLVDLGNTVIVIEHQLDVVRSADWIIDMGPEGGEKGGNVVGVGTPEQLLRFKKSHTAHALEKALKKRKGRMSKYAQQPLDLSGLHTIPIEARGGKVRIADFAKPYFPSHDRQGVVSKSHVGGIATLLDSLPHILAADSLRAVVEAIADARARKRMILWGLGGHVIKCGLAPILIDLMSRGYATGFALNGAAAIHDFEIAIAGQTSEDVEAVLPDGRFGTAEETGREMNRALESDSGFGEALGRHLETIADSRYRSASLLSEAYRNSTPVTVHVAIGTDTPHTHPSASGDAIGRATHHDFRLLCSLVTELNDGGIYLNVGSAVLLPEVFLKAVSVVRNLGNPLANFTTANFDFLQHYRPRVNVVERPHARSGGHGYSITGHHEIMIPLLAAALIESHP